MLVRERTREIENTRRRERERKEGEVCSEFFFYTFFVLCLSLSNSLTRLHSPSGGLTPTAGHARDIHAARAEAAAREEGFGSDDDGGRVSLSRPPCSPCSVAAAAAASEAAHLAVAAAIISATAPALAHA